MKYLKYVKYVGWVLFAVVSFIGGMWIFAPWENAGIYALDSVALAAAKNGMYVTYDAYESSGIVFPQYTIRGLTLDSPFSRISLSELRIKILPLSSFLARGVSSHVEFNSGEVKFVLTPNAPLTLGQGAFKLTMNASKIKLSNAQIQGDIGVNGNLTYSRSEKRIAESTLSLKVPENINMMLNNPMVSPYLESTTSGEWRLKENATPKP